MKQLRPNEPLKKQLRLHERLKRSNVGRLKRSDVGRPGRQRGSQVDNNGGNGGIHIRRLLVIALLSTVAHPPHTRKHTQARARTHKHAHTYTHTRARARVRTRHTRRRWTQEREDAPRIQDRRIVSLSLDHTIHYTTPKSDMTEITNATTGRDQNGGERAQVAGGRPDTSRFLLWEGSSPL